METSKQRQIRLRWYHLRCIKLTGEYGGGILAGFGLGISTMAVAFKSFDGWSLIMLLGMALIPIGGSIAMRAQDRYTTNDGDKDEHE